MKGQDFRKLKSAFHVFRSRSKAVSSHGDWCGDSGDYSGWNNTARVISLPAGMKLEDVDMTEKAGVASSLLSPILVSVKPRLSPRLCSMQT
ncbi:protein MpCYP829-like26 [Marchantia polymorpha subsp. ruderalis]|nr:hypothetical protein MARPO_0049s0101 [Marchantia polymorpha]BBN06221.1 hypothetical protein Mp_3g19330 [Marchantia polymorpha subsp. ruderalis]|eukprot:PTQ38822.1 hypothetical protein MARPO_0049s0101 [Marchantia polymorpha]